MKALGIVSESAEARVAGCAQQATNRAGTVIVINRERYLFQRSSVYARTPTYPVQIDGFLVPPTDGTSVSLHCPE